MSRCERRWRWSGKFTSLYDLLGPQLLQPGQPRLDVVRSLAPLREEIEGQGSREHLEETEGALKRGVVVVELVVVDAEEDVPRDGRGEVRVDILDDLWEAGASESVVVVAVAVAAPSSRTGSGKPVRLDRVMPIISSCTKVTS